MSNFIDYGKNNTRLRKIYNTEKVMLNDFTRRALQKRTGCFDNFGVRCNAQKETFCSAPLNTGYCVDPSSIVSTEPNKVMKSDRYAYSNNITAPPVFLDKYYNSLNYPVQVYDIGDQDPETMTDTQYYNYAKDVMKGPVQFILSSEGDPKKLTYYFAYNGTEPSTTETDFIFVDKRVEGEHKFVTARVDNADYSTGVMIVKAFAIEEGKQPSAVVTQKYEIKNFSTVFKKPAKRFTPYFVENLSNWFSLDRAKWTSAGSLDSFYPLSGALQPPLVGDVSGWKDASGSLLLKDSEIEVLGSYVNLLNTYNYTGPTSRNRDKLHSGYSTDTVTMFNASSFQYGQSSTHSYLENLLMDNFINIHDTNNWLKTNCNLIMHSSLTGGEITRTPGQVKFDRGVFRMNGNKIQCRTSNRFELKGVTFAFNKEFSFDSQGTALNSSLSSQRTVTVDTQNWSSGQDYKITVVYTAFTKFSTWTDVLILPNNLVFPPQGNVLPSAYLALKLMLEYIPNCQGRVVKDSETTSITVTMNSASDSNPSITEYQSRIWIPTTTVDGSWVEIENSNLNNIQYITNQGVPFSRSTMPEQADAYNRVTAEYVGYVKPGTYVPLSVTPSDLITSYGLRGAAIVENNSISSSGHLMTLNANAAYDWGTGKQVTSVPVNTNAPLGLYNSGFKHTIYCIPGIDTVEDLNDWKLRVQEYTQQQIDIPGTYDISLTDVSSAVDYTITHSFKERDGRYAYLGFAYPKISSPPANTVVPVDPSTLYTVGNKSAGFYQMGDTFIKSTTGQETVEGLASEKYLKTLLVCPDSYGTNGFDVPDLTCPNYSEAGSSSFSIPNNDFIPSYNYGVFGNVIKTDAPQYFDSQHAFNYEINYLPDTYVANKNNHSLIDVSVVQMKLVPKTMLG